MWNIKFLDYNNIVREFQNSLDKGSKLMNDFRPTGFTLIEFVVTIILISIIGAVVMSRFIGGNSFNGIIVRDQIISLARTAQQNAFGRAGVEMTITPNAGASEVTIETSDSGGSIESVTVTMTSLSLSGDINDTASCDVTSGADSINNAAPMTIAFGALGDLVDSGVAGSTGAVTSAVRVCINDDSDFSVCFSPSGFAYAGDCDV